MRQASDVRRQVVKNRLVTEKTPGLEDLAPIATTGDHGLGSSSPLRSASSARSRRSPIRPRPSSATRSGCSPPATASSSTSIPTRRAAACRRSPCSTRPSCDAGGPPNVVAASPIPTIESAQELMKHPGVRLVVVTGGGEVVKVAMDSGKRAICAGPGNPPVVVDETADIDKAGARHRPRRVHRQQHHLHRREGVDRRRLDRRRAHRVDGASRARSSFARAARASSSGSSSRDARPAAARGRSTRTLSARTPTSSSRRWGSRARLGRASSSPRSTEDHPLLWTEQMMPVMPRRPRPGRAIAPSTSPSQRRRRQPPHRGDALEEPRQSEPDGEGVRLLDLRQERPLAGGPRARRRRLLLFTIASPTGDGLTSPRSFSRWRRCTLVDHFRIT